MKNLITICFVLIAQLGITQDSIDLSQLQGSYNDLLVYVIKYLDNGPMGFLDNLSFEVKYDHSSKSGTMRDNKNTVRQFEVIKRDSIENIVFKSSDGHIREGIIERCDHEMLKIRFETTIEEYIRKN